MSVPDPATTDWVPLWSLGGAVGALPADTLIPAATRIISNKLLLADTQPVWRVMGDGRMDWGPGGSTAPDTSLYRITATPTLYCNQRFASGSPSGGGLWVDGAPPSASQFVGSFDSTRIGLYSGGWQLYASSAGHIEIGNPDTYIFRRAAGQVGVSTVLFSNGEIYATTSVSVDFGQTGAKLVFGSGDTFMWKGGAQNLFVAETLRVNASLVIGQNGALNYLYFSSALDVYLYRKSASGLETNGNFFCDGDLYSHYGANHHFETTGARGVAEVRLGPYGDCSIYRENVNVINHYSTLGAWGTFKAAAFAVQSDRATKNEIESAVVPVERLLGAGVYTYERNKEGGRHLGLLADELPDEVTDTATTPEGDTFQFVDLYKLTTAILATVQHLDERLKALEGNS